MNVAQLIGEEADGVDLDSLAALEQLPEHLWPALVGCCLANFACVEPAVPGIDCRVAVTHETVEDFDCSRTSVWSEAGVRSVETYEGVEFVVFTDAQVRRGMRRQAIAVCRVGELTAVLYEHAWCES